MKARWILLLLCLAWLSVSLWGVASWALLRGWPPSRSGGRRPIGHDIGQESRQDSRQVLLAPPPPSYLDPGEYDKIQISEVLAINDTALFDEDGKSPPWIELHNSGGETVNLEGFRLSDDSASPQKWIFPRAHVPPQGHLVVWLSGKDRRPSPRPRSSTQPISRSMFALGRELIGAGDEWRYWPVSPSFRRGLPRSWKDPDFDDRGFGVGSSGFGYEDEDDVTVLEPGTTAIFIRREFELDSVDGVHQLLLRIDYDDGFVAYLNGVRVASMNSPVAHPGVTAVAIGKHEAGERELFDLTPYVPALRVGRNVLAVVGLNAQPSSDLTLIPELAAVPAISHANFKLASESGPISLYAPDGRLLDGVVLPEQVADQSYGRPADGDGSWAYFLKPTPGHANSAVGFVEPVRGQVRFDPPAHFSTQAIEVGLEIESKMDLEIHYTTDGSDPHVGSTRFDVPLLLDRSGVVRAAGFLGSERATPVASASYLVGRRPSMRVLSVTMEPQAFAEVHLRGGARGRTSERRAHLDVFASSGELLGSSGCGLRLHGGAGRKGDLQTKKSYRAYFRKIYGAAELDCPLIPDTEVRLFDKLVLRGGYNDRLRPGRGHYNVRAAYLRDQVIRDLHRAMGAPSAHGSWCMLYVNGVCKGLYNVVERPDEDFLKSYLECDDWDVINTGEDVLDGTGEEWQALKEFVATHDLANDQSYRELQRRVDIENFTSYMIVNLWAQNHDWPHNNWYAARCRQPDSKWIFLVWDAEWGLGPNPSSFEHDSIAHSQTLRGLIRDLFVGLLRSRAYRRYFVSEVKRHLRGALHPDSVVPHIVRQFEQIDPVMRWELENYASTYNYRQWRASVEGIKNFARRRGEFFLGLVEKHFGE